MDFKTLKMFEKNIESKLSATENNVHELALKLSVHEYSVVMIWSTEKKILDDLKQKEKFKYATLYKNLKWGGDSAISTKGDAEALIFSDEDYHKLSVEISKQQHVVDVIEKTLDTIKKTGFSIKSYIELKKLREGII